MTLQEYFEKYKPILTQQDMDLFGNYVNAQNKITYDRSLGIMLANCTKYSGKLKTPSELYAVGAEFHSPPDAFSLEGHESLSSDILSVLGKKELTLYKRNDADLYFIKSDPNIIFQEWMLKELKEENGNTKRL